MTKLVDDKKNVERDRTKIQEATTRYYEDLFEDSSAENTRHDQTLKHLTEQSWDLWEFDDVCFNAEMVTAAISSMSTGKNTCGRGGLVSEVWRAIVWADERLRAQIAWASNMRLAPDPSVYGQRGPM